MLYVETVLPDRSSCTTWLLNPDGCHGVVHEHEQTGVSFSNYNMIVCLFVFTRPGGTHDRCFQPVTRFLPNLGQNPPKLVEVGAMTYFQIDSFGIYMLWGIQK
jgi:hypothetical protein